jgi:threonylcarbamoyladenosine tRNA methylthiotransferase MtaB
MFALRAKLSTVGYAAVDEIENADIVIVNTCSVTSSTESKTGRFIRSISKNAPNAQILITGCFAQQHGEALLKYPGVRWVVGNGDKHLIASIIKSNSGNGLFLSDINASGGHVFWEDDILGPDESGRTRFSVKIQEGCDFKCAYCIVPSLRGRSRSAPKGQLVETFKRALDKGYKEIVLTGTHIGQYCDPGGLESLLEEFLKIPGDYRIRLSSLDPRDLTDTLISIVGEENRVCDHLHVSVQSLCADVLSGMARPHDKLDMLIKRLHDFREKYPQSGLGADFIVGHPGETGVMFETTLRGVESIGFTYAHIFRFSKRRGTPSALMPGQISELEKKKRSERLREAIAESRKKYLSLLLGRPLCILVEDGSPARGISGNYLKIEIPGADFSKNSWVRAALIGIAGDGRCIAEEIVDAGGAKPI